MLTILLYVSLISGGILILMVLLTLFSGLDFDIDFGDSDDGGSIIKGTLTFFSVGAYIVRGFLMADNNPGLVGCRSHLWCHCSVNLNLYS